MECKINKNVYIIKEENNSVPKVPEGKTNLIWTVLA